MLVGGYKCVMRNNAQQVYIGDPHNMTLNSKTGRDKKKRRNLHPSQSYSLFIIIAQGDIM